MCMKITCVRFLSVVGCLCIFWAVQLAAEESPFTINVPVELRDMHPDIGGGEINCSVRDAQETPIAGGTVPFSIDRNTRSFTNTITVATQLVTGRTPLDARDYQCVIWLIDTTNNIRSLAQAPGGQGDPRFEALAGTSFVPIVSGPIPSTLPSISAPMKPVKNTGTIQ